MPSSVILDVDPGVDDALAILFALRSPELCVRGITCVAGNVGVEQALANTLKVLDAADAPDIAVAPGAGAPLSGAAAAPARPRSVHGADGLADLGLPPSRRRTAPISAGELLRREILATREPVSLVACGPLTNLALLLRTAPGMLQRLRHLVVVGGRATGEIGTADDFNLGYDAEAAAAVLGSGAPVTMYTLDVFFEVALSEADVDDLVVSDDVGTRVAGLLARHQARRFRARGACLGDAGAVMAVVAPDELRTRVHPELPGVRVAVEVNVSRYRRLFLDTLGAPAPPHLRP